MLDRILQLFNQKKVNIHDFQRVAVDIHSHLIPGIDDGSPSIEMSLELIRGLIDLGYKKIITTPHVMPGVYDNTNKSILAGRDLVREAIRKEQLEIEFDAAAEYYIDEMFEQRIEDKSDPLLTIGDKYILFETSFAFEPVNLKNVIFKLNTEGYKPILAHPERYQYMHSNDISRYKELKEMGVYYQINISSLSGIYTKKVKSIAQKLIDNNLVDFIGTDLHNKKHLDFLKSSLNEIYLEKLINSNKLLNKQLL